jgi:hypothetical protein
MVDGGMGDGGMGDRIESTAPTTVPTAKHTEETGDEREREEPTCVNLNVDLGRMSVTHMQGASAGGDAEEAMIGTLQGCLGEVKLNMDLQV